MKRNILILTTALLLTGTLTACNSNTKPECWKAKHNAVGKDCNSSGNGGFSMNSPSRKGTDGKKRSVDAPKTNDGGTNQNVPAKDNSPTNDTASEPNVPDQETDVRPPPQSNSNDIKGYDPFGGLYGPGT
jgi:hypothetical protein